jgi:hypothetical protein
VPLEDRFGVNTTGVGRVRCSFVKLRFEHDAQSASFSCIEGHFHRAEKTVENYGTKVLHRRYVGRGFGNTERVLQGAKAFNKFRHCLWDN